MPRTSFRKIDYGSYHKCLLCNYELKNNKIALRLHMKYSHPEEEEGLKDGNEDRLVCSVCKKKDCKMH